VTARSCVVVAVVALLTGEGAGAGESASRLGLTLVARGFDDPVHVAAPRGEPDMLYVVQRDGRVYAIDRSTAQIRLFLDLSRRVGRRGFQGLHSIAFHPRYASNLRLYVFYATSRNTVYVDEYRSQQGRVDPGTRRVILKVPQPKQEPYAHFGGQLAFGPGGRLYTAIGDGVGNGAQNPGDLCGKLIRLDVWSGRRPVVIGRGLRNPWRFSFDRRTGALYIADVGEEAWEEVNLIRRGGARPLLNFGWDVYEGRHRGPDGDNTRLAGRLLHPLAVYRQAAGNCSITGGFVYRGAAVPSARGRYFFGDLCSGRIWTLRAGAGQETMRPTGLKVRQLSSFGEDARGELYVVSRRGRVYRLTERTGGS
jgi:glucose/arabinose dehydrogenase